MKKEKCEMCGKMVSIEKIDNHHPNKKENPKNIIRICKDCHFKIHNKKKVEEKNVLKDGVVFIPKKILFNKELSSSAKVLYAILVNKIGKDSYCLTNNKDISEIMDITKTHASRLFSQLDKYLIIKDRTMAKRSISLEK